MIAPKFFDIFRSLSKDELKKFGDYLNSPIFNKRKVIVRLFEAYKKFYPDFDDKNLTKEKIFKKISPDKKYNDEIFRNLNSLLLTQAEDFLSFINYSKDNFTVKKHLLSEINHRNILTIFEKNFEEGKKLLESFEHKDIEHFYNEYILFHQKDSYNSFRNKFSKDDIIHSEKNILVFFILKILEIQNYILYECRILGIDKSLYLNENIIDEFFKKIPQEIIRMPQIQIYYNALKLEQTSNEKYYSNLKQLLNEYGRLIEKEKHFNMYQVMMEYLKRTRDRDDLETASELFHIRKRIVENGLMTENFMKNMFFLNLVKSGIRVEEFEWVYNFINGYSHLLIPKYRESTSDLSLALYHFEKKEFNESLSYAAKVKYEDSFYSLEVKNLTTRIYYEMNQYEMLTNFIMSYRMYLSKNRSLSKNDFDSHHTFLNYLDKLIRIKETKKNYKLDNLINQINKNDFINKIWVLEKVNDLED